MKYLVITADDLGYSKERNNGIAECFRKGLTTNTSLMVNGIAAEHAVELSREYGIHMGLHFNISEGVPIAESTKSSSLVNKDGVFLGPAAFWQAARNGELSKKDVRIELEAQLKRFETLVGRPVAHVDGHQHVHTTPGVCEVFAEVLREQGVKSTRLPIDVTVEIGEWNPSRHADSLIQINMCKHSQEIQSVYQNNGIRVSDCYFGLTTMGRDMNVERIKSGLLHAYSSVNTKKDNPVCEFMVHPGYRNGDIGGCGTGPDDFSQSEEREHEMAVLADDKLLDFYKREQIKLVPFSECW